MEVKEQFDLDYTTGILRIIISGRSDILVKYLVLTKVGDINLLSCSTFGVYRPNDYIM